LTHRSKVETEIKALVAYFSASGVTAKLAKCLADAIEAPLYEIRPALADADAPVADADIIFVGYPVWWYREPSIIDSFLAAYDFSGKKIVLFATSGGSDIGREAPARAAEITKAEVLPGKRFAGKASTMS